MPKSESGLRHRRSEPVAVAPALPADTLLERTKKSSSGGPCCVLFNSDACYHLAKLRSDGLALTFAIIQLISTVMALTSSSCATSQASSFSELAIASVDLVCIIVLVSWQRGNSLKDIGKLTLSVDEELVSLHDNIEEEERRACGDERDRLINFHDKKRNLLSQLRREQQLRWVGATSVNAINIALLLVVSAIEVARWIYSVNSLKDSCPVVISLLSNHTYIEGVQANAVGTALIEQDDSLNNTMNLLAVIATMLLIAVNALWTLVESQQAALANLLSDIRGVNLRLLNGQAVEPPVVEKVTDRTRLMEARPKGFDTRPISVDSDQTTFGGARLANSMEMV